MKPLFFVGSLPFQSVKEAIWFVKDNASHLPFLPQLPELNPQEDMIGQVLRGFELGYWDEKASIALEAFQNEFCESPRFKIQIAGPYTISRTLSLSELEVWRDWERLVQGLSKQLRQGSFLGELWLQIDEPFWSGDEKPKDGYFERLAVLKEKLTKTVWGLHSCATKRPEFSEEEINQFRFLSFDCEKTKAKTAEKEKWEAWLLRDPARVLAWGTTRAQEMDAWAMGSAGVWISSPCGLTTR